MSSGSLGSVIACSILGPIISNNEKKHRFGWNSDFNRFIHDSFQ